MLNNELMSNYVTRRRKKLRKWILSLRGGKCQICGYDKCHWALHFHHVSPSEKEFSMARIYSKSIENIISEIKKCILVCSNCHYEIHGEIIPLSKIKGLVQLPISECKWNPQEYGIMKYDRDIKNNDVVCVEYNIGEFKKYINNNISNANYSQRSLSKRLGISKSTLYNYMDGKTYVPMWIHTRIGSMLKTPPPTPIKRHNKYEKNIEITKNRMKDSVYVEKMNSIRHVFTPDDRKKGQDKSREKWKILKEKYIQNIDVNESKINIPTQI